jgi:hypothetical protein
MVAVAHDFHPNLEWARRKEVEYVDSDALAAGSDVLSLHLPLLPETKDGTGTFARVGSEGGRPSAGASPSLAVDGDSAGSGLVVC